MSNLLGWKGYFGYAEAKSTTKEINGNKVHGIVCCMSYIFKLYPRWLVMAQPIRVAIAGYGNL